jgi:hypothetical protein
MKGVTQTAGTIRAERTKERRMSTRIMGLGFATGGFVLALSFNVSNAAWAADAPPTFSKDVAPILLESCSACHRPGQMAPMSLLSYDEARPWAKAIKTKVVSREMPPWFADHTTSMKFRNDRSLTSKEIATIAGWVDAGAPRGNPADMPPLPPFPSGGWRHPQGLAPDVVISMPIEFEIPAEGEIDYQNFYVKIPFAEDRFVEAVEMRPGNPAVVHHSIVNIVELSPDTTFDEMFRIAGRPTSREENAEGARTEGRRWKLIGNAPGKGFENHRPGVAKRLSPGMYFEFNLHYQPTGRPEKDRTELALWFSKGPVEHEVITETVSTKLSVVGRPVERRKIPNIPPHAENWEIVGEKTFDEPATLYALSPHMHLRGKDMKYILKYPDGREQVVLNVPKFDFNWQLHYELEQPVKIPAGSTMVCVAHYDNSIANKYNPAPDKEVYWSEQSWDEMFSGFIEYSIDTKKIGNTPSSQN